MTRLPSARSLSVAASLAAGTLILGALSAPDADAAPEATCAGETATVVGKPRAWKLYGTEGRDVIVTNGAEWVEALGGDDLVCVTGDTRTVIAGTGADDVRNLQLAGTLPRGTSMSAHLGPGSDTYLGGPDADFVFADDDFPGERADRDDLDVVRTGAGNDGVASGRPYSRLVDTIELGSGRDLAFLDALSGAPSFSLSGGSGRDMIVIAREAKGALLKADWVFDNRSSAGIATADGEAALNWTSFERFVLEPRFSSTRFYGGDSDERVSAMTLREADLGAGDDVIEYTMAHPRRSVLRGGPGSDRFVTHFQDEQAECLGTATVRLAAGTYVCDDDPAYRASLDGFEGVRIAAGRVDIAGSRRANTILVHARCGGTVRAGYGADRVTIRRPRYGCRPVLDWRPIRVDGGPGDDELVGWIRRDVLIGGPGRDSADGRADVDRCVAERRVSCEE
ncbi:hypothetical protein [Nocardioides sp. GXZ039]|uniref:hypothetical protein n=1 Tax=Nocardioides sp. GXZ039 TaxID=3136018 RepID=UPI0030F3BAA2